MARARAGSRRPRRLRKQSSEHCVTSAPLQSCLSSGKHSPHSTLSLASRKRDALGLGVSARVCCAGRAGAVAWRVLALVRPDFSQRRGGGSMCVALAWRSVGVIRAAGDQATRRGGVPLLLLRRCVGLDVGRSRLVLKVSVSYGSRGTTSPCARAARFALRTQRTSRVVVQRRKPLRWAGETVAHDPEEERLGQLGFHVPSGSTVVAWSYGLVSPGSGLRAGASPLPWSIMQGGAELITTRVCGVFGAPDSRMLGCFGVHPRLPGCFGVFPGPQVLGCFRGPSTPLAPEEDSERGGEVELREDFQRNRLSVADEDRSVRHCLLALSGGPHWGSPLGDPQLRREEVHVSECPVSSSKGRWAPGAPGPWDQRVMKVWECLTRRGRAPDLCSAVSSNPGPADHTDIMEPAERS
ncbi:unnamed protein product [Arctogadus glacialis]